MHPHGAEVVICTAGEMLLTQEFPDGRVERTMLGAGDCAVIISNSGRSRDLLDAADVARRQGAVTIVITASASPLALTAQGRGHILLAVDHPEDYERYSPMVSRMLHLMTIDILSTAVALRLPAERRQVLQEIKKNLRIRRAAAA